MSKKLWTKESNKMQGVASLHRKGPLRGALSHRRRGLVQYLRSHQTILNVSGRVM